MSCYYRVMMIELVNHLKYVRTISEVKCVLLSLSVLIFVLPLLYNSKYMIVYQM